MLKFRCKTLIGYEPRKSKQADQGGLLRDHKSTPVKHKHMPSPPACSSPRITEDLPGSWPVHEKMDSSNNSVCTVPQTVRYHKLPPPATSQARLHGVLGRRSMYETLLARTVGCDLCTVQSLEENDAIRVE
jgi:hypothetical protein